MIRTVSPRYVYTVTSNRPSGSTPKQMWRCSSLASGSASVSACGSSRDIAASAKSTSCFLRFFCRLVGIPLIPVHSRNGMYKCAQASRDRRTFRRAWRFAGVARPRLPPRIATASLRSRAVRGSHLRSVVVGQVALDRLAAAPELVLAFGQPLAHLRKLARECFEGTVERRMPCYEPDAPTSDRFAM